MRPLRGKSRPFLEAMSGRESLRQHGSTTYSGPQTCFHPVCCPESFLPGKATAEEEAQALRPPYELWACSRPEQGCRPDTEHLFGSRRRRLFWYRAGCEGPTEFALPGTRASTSERRREKGRM